MLFNRASKVCPTGCKHNGIPVHRRACKHKDQAPSATVSKISTDRSVGGEHSHGRLLHWDSVWHRLSTQFYFSISSLYYPSPYMFYLGTSSKVRIMTYAGEGTTILTTEVKLKLQGKILMLSIIQEDLNNGSGFSLSVSHKWRTLTDTSTSHHTGQISILLGGDNHLFFPTEIERDSWRMALYQSNLRKNYMLYDSVPANTITWENPLVLSTTNTM